MNLTKTFSASLLSLALAPLALTHSQEAKAVDVNRDCAAMYGSSFTPVTGYIGAAPPPTTSRPAKGVVTRDPNFKTCVIRATNHATETSTSFAKSHYARRQAFNADNTRILVYTHGGTWHLYDANTLARIRTLSGPTDFSEPQWDPKDPRILYYIPNGGAPRLLKLDTETNQSTLAADFTGRLPWGDAVKIAGSEEASPSADGRYWCLMAMNSASGIRGVFTYDLVNRTVMGTRSLSNKPNNVSMSPSGRSCVITGGDASNAMVAWNPSFTTSRTIHAKEEHADLAIGADGNDYAVFVDYGNGGNLVMADLATGARTTLFSIYNNGTSTGYHLSAKSFARPGWILMETYRESNANLLANRLMAVELKANPTIINLAHHQSYQNGFWTQPQATVSRDFSRVLFGSNWGTTSNLDIDAFMIRLPDNLFGGTAPAPAPAPTCTRAAPAISLSGSTTAVAAGTTASYVINLTNKDSSACAATTFNLAKSIPTGWTGSLSTGSLTLSPGASSTANLTVTSLTASSPLGASSGTYSVGVGTASSVGSIHTTSASSTYTALAPASTCTRATPAISLSGSTTAVAAGTSKSYTISLTNKDSSACAATTFNLAKSIPTGWTGSLSTGSLTLSPGASSTANLTVTSLTASSPLGASSGTYSVGVGTASSVGSIHTTSASSTYTALAPASTCTRAAPAISLSGSTTAVAAGTTNSYTISLTNKDSSACAATTFNLAKSIPAGWTSNLSTGSLTLNPGASSTASLTVTSSSTASAGTYGIGAGTSSGAGSTHTSSASTTYTITSPTKTSRGQQQWRKLRIDSP